MTEESNTDPAGKMRNLLGGEKASPVARLPRKDGGVASFLPQQVDDKKNLSTSTVPMVKKSPPQTQPKPASPKKAAPSLKGMSFGPPFWTIASIISMTVNVVVLIVLLALLLNMKRLNMGSVLDLGNNLLGGLYTNFEKMDRAHITSTIPVQTTIPVKFDLQLNQQTNVILSEDVTINNALVTVNTGGLNITRALTTIVLPQGTILPVVLNLSVPVDTTVPVVLNVAVDIPLNQTQLHEPFSGLQEVVKPFYCMISPNAVNLDGLPVCK
ncbi:MAG: hypothetical protein H7Y59_17895 [Anaerolineales bacterium]|nr:hypothetical protein [Anaerolineales bacterium]